MRPVTIVVGYPAGGSVDFAARNLSEALAKSLSATIVIDNVGGAAGAIGAQKVVGSPANGHTLLVGSSNEIVATKLINPTQRYDGMKDLVPVGLIGSQALVLVASKQSGVTTLDGFVSAVKKNPGKFSYGSSGIGSILHLAGEMAKERADLAMTHVPYRGIAAIGNDLAGGNLEFGFMAPSSAKPFIESGRVVPIAVTGAQRFPELPQVPAFAEHPAFKGYELVGWYAMMAPRGTPASVIAKLRAALRAALRDATVARAFEQASVTVAKGDEDLAQMISDDTRKLQKVVAFAKLDK
ncbi:Bug family tripartite tricarboxylate transporter substrate binding protein [Variovorax davisae]|uniref:Bug family tripartite tricarboxylate transporter substrate binding protein n=1 Tax=Variovorax davisae TaxID=3053515 RepID=UPI004037F844